MFSSGELSEDVGEDAEEEAARRRQRGGVPHFLAATPPFPRNRVTTGCRSDEEKERK